VSRTPSSPDGIHHRRIAFGLVAALMLGTLPYEARAQQSAALGRLSPASRSAIDVLMDSATRIGIPREALLSKTLEGISKGRPGPQIVQVVRRYFGALREAQGSLGPEASLDELTAAAGAIQSGVDPGSIVRLRSNRRGGSILMPLVVLADLVSRGVPSDDASSAIVSMSQRGALDSDYEGLWKGVQQDIISGAPPVEALNRRAREFPGRAPPTPGRVTPPATQRPEIPS
jgi:hypothetical protein